MSDSFFGDADAAIARVNAQIVEAQERAAKASEMRAQVEAVRGKAVSPRNEVSVTVDASGRLTELDLSEAALELSPRDLSRLILTTTDQARQKAGQQSVALAAEAFGEDSNIVDRLRAEVEKPAIPGDGLNDRSV